MTNLSAGDVIVTFSFFKSDSFGFSTEGTVLIIIQSRIAAVRNLKNINFENINLIVFDINSKTANETLKQIEKQFGRIQ